MAAKPSKTLRIFSIVAQGKGKHMTDETKIITENNADVFTGFFLAFAIVLSNQIFTFEVNIFTIKIIINPKIYI